MRSASTVPPGPRLPPVVQAVRYVFDFPRFWASSRRRYGRTWTLRLPGFPPGVVTSDRDAIRRLLTGDPLTKRHGNDLLRPFLGDGSIMLLEPADHLARRRLELGPFHGDRVRSYEARVRELMDEEVDGWREGTVVEVHPRAQALTLAIILELVLGVRDPALRTGLRELFEGLTSPKGNLGLFLGETVMRRSWWNLASRSAWGLADRMDALLFAQIAATRADPELEDRVDVLAMLMTARDEDGEGLSDQELRDELVTLVTAGHETTATAIAWAADLLAHHPAVAARVRETMGEGNRSYLKATAKEVLRVRTVAPISAARMPLEPFGIDGWLLGPDVAILVNAEDLHHDPEVHPDPDAFRPERFLDDPPDGYSYLPFGGGAHRCLGAALATLELETAIELMTTRCDLAPAGPPSGSMRRGVTLAPSSRGAVGVMQTRPAETAAPPPMESVR